MVALVGLALAAQYQLSSPWAFAALFAGGGLLCLTSRLWIAAIPLVLIAGDRYPWTGSLLLSESDFFLLGALAVLLWRADVHPRLVAIDKRFWILWAPLLVSAAVSCIIGWRALPPSVPGDQLCLYASQWNSVRVFKGFAWGLMLAQLLFAKLDRNQDGLRLVSHGMRISALYVALVVIGERLVSVGVFNLDDLYRATGPFFSMHTGGLQIDAFWAISLPFLFVPPTGARPWLTWLARLALLLVSFYAIGATMARGIIVWAAVATLLLSFLVVVRNRRQPNRTPVYVFAAGSVCFIFAGIALLPRSEAVIDRFGSLVTDLQTRALSWQTFLRQSDKGVTSAVFGNGLGTAPGLVASAYDLPTRSAELIPMPDGRKALRLTPGKSVFVEQLIDSDAPGPWTLRARGQSFGGAAVHVHVCEKTLLHSFRCAEATLMLHGGQASPAVQPIDVSALRSASHHWIRCPVTFALSVSGNSGQVDITYLRLEDARGENILANYDFGTGSARWFFTSDDLAAWRVENLWVHLFLEQGWLGVLAAGWLLIATLAPLAYRAATEREPSSIIQAVSILGFLAMGTFGSLLDTPSITELTCVVLAASQAIGRRSEPLANPLGRIPVGS